MYWQATADAERAVAQIQNVVGRGGVVDNPAPFLVDEHTGLKGESLLVVQPDTVEQVSEVVKICARHDVAVVPQGGLTGLVAGAIPSAGGSSVVILLRRLNRIRAIQPANYTVAADAGVVLVDLQTELASHDLRFPLALGSGASCQVGGLVATNAGGIAALRFGSMRDLTLGLEVVLADGRVWDGMRSIRKDNTGYDLKQFFVGSEGTLGVITGAVLKLQPRPSETAVAFAALSGRNALTPLFRDARSAIGEFLSAFEFVSAIGLEHALATDPRLRRPLAGRYDDYILIALEAGGNLIEAGSLLQQWLEAKLSEGLIVDAAVATSDAKAEALWRIRELTPWAAMPSIQFDVSVPVDSITEFLDQAETIVHRLEPGARVNAFGHFGDGNVHYHICPPLGTDGDVFVQRRPTFSDAIHDLASGLGGSFSAEHGFGLVRKRELLRYKSDIELDAMRKVKGALDPRGLMNPGKVFDARS